jgi:hypothetical protein
MNKDLKQLLWLLFSGTVMIYLGMCFANATFIVSEFNPEGRAFITGIWLILCTICIGSYIEKTTDTEDHE